MTKKEPENITFEAIINMVKTVVMETGEFPPTLYVIGEKGMFDVPLDFTGDANARQQFMYQIGYEFAGMEAEPVSLFLITEGWMSVGKHPGEMPPMPPSQDPDRIEILKIDHWDFERAALEDVIYQMIRDESGTLVKLDEIQRPGDWTAQNYLIDAFLRGYGDGLTASVPGVVIVQ